ncbi:MAG: thiazole biosynthesis adenylyltransferase ThiF, partial [Deltaproteobacteria bacterium]
MEAENTNAGRQGRYARQTVLEEIGTEGQRRLADAAVAVMGCGALGTHQASWLARAGVG